MSYYTIGKKIIKLLKVEALKFDEMILQYCRSLRITKNFLVSYSIWAIDPGVLRKPFL